MSWTTTITSAGYRLIVNTPGHTLKYTRAACSSKPTPADDVAALTELAEYVMNLSIVEYYPQDDVALLRLQLDNSTVTTPFNLYQIGVWAQLLEEDGTPVGEEVLLLVVQDEENPDHIRTNPQASEYLVNTVIGQAEHLEVNVDMAAYVSIAVFRDLRSTVQELQEEIERLRQELSKKVNKESYEEYDLDFIEGISAVNGRRCAYSKDPFNRVYFFLQATTTGGGIQSGTISTLPEGFKPAAVVAIPATGLNSSGRYLCTVDINPDGQVMIRFDGNVGTLTSIFSNGSFIAND